MKKFISLFLSIILICINAVNVCAAGGAIVVGDSSSETLFTGSVSSHYLLLSSNGVVSAWGDNTYGQCGTEPCDATAAVNYIDFENKVTKVLAGNGFSLALDENNTAWGWGDNRQFQLGISSPATQFSTPVKISENIADIAVGENFSVLLNKNGEILFSGMGQSDVLKALELPKSAEGDFAIRLIAAAYNNIAAVDENNTVYWMKSDAGSEEVTELPKNVEVESVTAGKEHLVFKCSDSDNTYIYTCGDNSKKQLGAEDLTYSKMPVQVLSLPRSEYEFVNVFAGEYNVIVDAWSNMDFHDPVTVYSWGSGCCEINADGCSEKDTIPRPEEQSRYNQLIAMGAGKYMAFEYINDNIELYGLDNMPITTIPLIETDDDLQTFFQYQYDNTEYQTYTVNFVKLNEETFQNGNRLYDEATGDYTEKYLYWEFVDEHHFRAKIKDFTSGPTARAYQSVVRLDKEITGENRTVGGYGPSVWAFRLRDISLKTDTMTAEYGREDGTIIPITATQRIFSGTAKPILENEVPVFYEEPGTISEETQLGLYLYSLPDGVEAKAVWNDSSEMEIRLSGNSRVNLDEETQLKFCLVHITNAPELAGKIGDYDLYNTSLNVSYGRIQGFSICPPVIYNISDLRLLSKTGETMETIPADSDFITAVDFNKTGADSTKDTLFLAVYDTDGALLYIDSVDARFTENYNYSYDFYVPAQEKEVGKIKTFVWNERDAMLPLGTARELINE